MFFVFGSPRSGTTLLAQCLNAHSRIVVPHETDFIIPMAFIFDRVQDKGVGRALISKLIVNTTGFPISIGEYLDAGAVREIVYSSDYHPASILHALYERIAAAAGADMAGDKSPNDLQYVRKLVKTGGLSPGTKIIHIVRDVRDLMISVNKTGWVSDLDLYFPRFWCNSNLYLHALYGHNGSAYRLVRYEDFVTDPEKELGRLTSFLGFAYEPGMTRPENRHQRYRGAEVHANLYNPISTTPVGKHRVVLDDATRDNYVTQAREALQVFGYLEPGA